MTTENQIAVLAPSERAAVGLNSTKTEAELRAMVAASADIVEVKDKAGRQQVHAAAMALRTRWTDIDKTGKELRDDANKFSAAVIEEAKRLTDIIKPEGVRLIALRDGYDAEQERIEAEKVAAERARMEAHENNIAAIMRIPADCSDMSSGEIMAVIDAADMKWAMSGNSWEEYEQRATEAYDATKAKLRELHGIKLAAEEAARAAAEAAEAERLRQAAEREALARQKAEQEAEATRLAAVAAELEAKAKAERDAAAARAAAEQAERDRVAAETKRKMESQQAALAEQRRAFEAEQKAFADKQAAQAAEEQRRKEELAAAAKLEADHAEALEMNASHDKAFAEWKAQQADTRPRIIVELDTFEDAPPVIEAAPTLRLGQIAERLGFKLSQADLSTLGFEPSGRDKAAVLYFEHQFPNICVALVERINAAKLAWVAA